jgi:hypothetical protein
MTTIFLSAQQNRLSDRLKRSPNQLLDQFASPLLPAARVSSLPSPVKDGIH